MKKYVLGAVVALSSVAAQAQTTTNVGGGELKISGFADFRLNSLTVKDDPTNPNTSAEGGFNLDDGAIYLNYTTGDLSITVDAPFRRVQARDSGTTGAGSEASPNGNFLFGGDKAQAFGRYKINEMFTVQAGQFDTPFGVEVNDSKDRYFSRTGLIYDNFLPVVHSGVVAEGNFSGVLVRLMSANSNNNGSLQNNTTSPETNLEYGALVGWSNETYRAQAGYLTRPTLKTPGAQRDGKRELLDVTAGMTMAGVVVDLEYSSLKNEASSTDTGTGLLALVSYQFTETLSAGIRYETVDKVPGGVTGAVSNATKADGIGGAVHYTVNPAMELRGEYISTTYKDTANLNAKGERFTIASVFKF